MPPPISTITWNEVLELARNLGAKKIQIGADDKKVCQLVAARMYTYRPWSFHCINAPINSTLLVTGTQDYPAPSDMYDLTQCWITVTYPQSNGQPYDPFNTGLGGSPDQDYNLEVVKNITPDKNPLGYFGNGIATFINRYGVIRLGNALQLPTQGPCYLNMTYQPIMEKVTDTSMPLPFPDSHVQTAVEGCLYWLYKFGDDDRAGTVIKQGNAIEYTGQLGAFEAMLFQAAQDDQASEVDNFFPSDPIGHQWNWGPFPYIWVS